MARGSFGTVRLAAARPPSACQPSTTGDVGIQMDLVNNRKDCRCESDVLGRVITSEFAHLAASLGVEVVTEWQLAARC